jgi:two-component system chemotaxis response regulator CheB
VTVDERAGAAIDSANDPFETLQVVALVASAGGLKALAAVLHALPADFPAAVVIVQHMDPHYRSMLPQILTKRTELVVKQAQGGDALAPGVVLIAPPDQHLLLNPNGTLSLAHSEPVHYVRPSGDLLFESVAIACRQRAIAVVLTGTGSDGSDGIRAIKREGGTVIVQERATAEYRGMPTSAVKTGRVDLELPLDEIGPALVDLVTRGGAK